MECCYCQGGRNGFVYHASCRAEWRRRVREGACQYCGRPGAPDRCGACKLIPHAPFCGYPGE